jgi:hypothetical protein
MEDEPPGEKKKEVKKRKPTIFYGGHGEPRLESIAIPLPEGLEIRVNVSHGSFPFRPLSQVTRGPRADGGPASERRPSSTAIMAPRARRPPVSIQSAEATKVIASGAVKQRLDVQRLSIGRREPLAFAALMARRAERSHVNIPSAAPTEDELSTDIIFRVMLRHCLAMCACVVADPKEVRLWRMLCESSEKIIEGVMRLGFGALRARMQKVGAPRLVLLPRRARAARITRTTCRFLQHASLWGVALWCASRRILSIGPILAAIRALTY